MKQLKTVVAGAFLAIALTLSGAIAGTTQVGAAQLKSPCVSIDRVLAKLTPQSRLYQPLTTLSKQCHLAFPTPK